MTEHDRSLPPLDSLLEHRSWVQAFARRLLRDEAAADDLAQEAWIRALRSPPDPARDPKPWLRRVLKNLASNARRGAGRRAKHEQVGGAQRARGREGTRSPAALVAEAEQHRRLVGHVLDLEEPFKTVLVLRFYQGLTPTEIAQRTDTAVGTVHSRLSRAVARLKARLDAEEGGDRRAWIAGLLPLAGTRRLASATTTAGTAAATAGVLMTLTKSKFAWLTLLLVGCLAGGGLLAHSLTSGEDAREGDLALRGVDAPDTGPELAARGTPRSAAAPPAAPDRLAGDVPSGALAPTPPGVRWHGIVRDTEGHPVRQAEVFVLPREAIGVNGPTHGDPRLGGTTTDAKGRFVVSPASVRHPRLVAWSHFHLPASIDLEGHDPAEAIELVVKPPRIVRVRVTREGHEGFLPLGVTVQTQGELSDRTHDPAQQATWVQSAEATDDTDVTLPMRVNTTAPLEVTFDAPRGYTTIPLRHRIPAATGTERDEETQRCAFRVVPSATLRYRLVDAATDAPLRGSIRTRFFLFAAGTKDVIASASTAEPRFEVTTDLPPGRYRYELHAAGYETVAGDVHVQRPGEAVTGTLRLVPAAPETGGQLVLTLRHPALVPDRIKKLARHLHTRGSPDGYAVFLRRHGETGWIGAFGHPGTDVHGMPSEDPSVRVAPLALKAARARFPEGTYDVVVARNGHGTAAFLRDVRIFPDQDTQLDVALEPGVFLELGGTFPPDLPLKALEVRASGNEAWGTLPFVQFRSGGHSAYTTKDDIAALLAIPRGHVLLGPFPAKELLVRIVPTEGAARTMVVR